MVNRKVYKNVVAADNEKTTREKVGPIEHLNKFILDQVNSGHAIDRWQLYFKSIRELSKGLPVPVLGVMLLIWQLREKDLGQIFSLNTRNGRLDFIGWCITNGRSEYTALRQATSFWDALNCPVTLSQDCDKHDAGNAISWMMSLILRVRQDLRFDLSTKEGREQLLIWYIVHGRSEYGYDDEPLESWQTAYLLSASSIQGLNHLQEHIYNSREDLRRKFSFPTGLDAYKHWFKNYIAVETQLIDALRTKQLRTNNTTASDIKQNFPFGANIIGYALGQLGIGEDARMAAQSLLTTNVPVTMVNFTPGSDVANSDTSMIQYIGGDAQYAINIFCLSSMEHGRYFAEKGTVDFSRHYNIGYWPWELAQWPTEWQHLFALVDEIWVSSQHTYDAVVPICPVPVRLMHMAVAPLSYSKRTRFDFSLPESATLFFFAFDLNSSVTRKNPEACVAAFLNAFPAQQNEEFGPEKLGLVIKVHPPKTPSRAWDALKELQQNDPRIHLIEATLSKEDLLALYRMCDCFVSLHRAEGFGRCIAEAMLLSKPVIVTGYSGNLTFTTKENAFLVDYSVKKLTESDYPFGTNQIWAEPDIIDAARQMRKIIRFPKLANQIGQYAHSHINKFHSPELIGQRYAEALREIYANNGGRF